MESRLTHLLLEAIHGWNNQFQVLFQPRLDYTYPLLIVSPKYTIGSTGMGRQVRKKDNTCMRTVQQY